MMKNSLFVIALSMLTACNSIEPRPNTANNGINSYTISCHSIDGTANACHQKAEKACVDGFSIVEHESHTIEYVSSGDGFYMPPKHVLAVVCNPA